MKTPLETSTSFVEQDIADARALITAILRINCPNVFQSEEVRKKAFFIPAKEKNKLLKIANKFPQALNLSDIDGRTPFTWLVRYHEPELIETFLSLGANPKGVFGQTPLGIHPFAQACELNYGECLMILSRENGVDAQVMEQNNMDELDDYGDSRPLFMAAMHCNMRAISTLLSLGANPLNKTQGGQTPLHALAFYKKNIENAGPCVDLLLKANPELLFTLNANHQTPRMLAEKNQSPMVTYFLAKEEEHLLHLQQRTIPILKIPKRI